MFGKYYFDRKKLNSMKNKEIRVLGFLYFYNNILILYVIHVFEFFKNCCYYFKVIEKICVFILSEKIIPFTFPSGIFTFWM